MKLGIRNLSRVDLAYGNKQQQGFTIVELLIVIVVIGILAAIVIVAYTGISQQARDTGAQSTAESIIKKYQLYFAEKSVYPATYSVLTDSAAKNEAWYIPSSSYTLYSALSANSKETDFRYIRCDSGQSGMIQVHDFISGGTVMHSTYLAGVKVPTTCAAISS